jgi:hypothetical protein
MFRCLVICISLVNNTMFTPGLAIFYLATILRLDHVCGVQWSRVWRKSRFLERSKLTDAHFTYPRPPVIAAFIACAKSIRFNT